MNGEWNLVEVLRWITGTGGAVLTTMFFSWLADLWPKWREWQQPQLKLLIVVAVNVLISVIAWAILTYVPPEVLAQLQPVFAVIMTAIASTLGTQVWHKKVNQNGSTLKVQIGELSAPPPFEDKVADEVLQRRLKNL